MKLKVACPARTTARISMPRKGKNLTRLGIDLRHVYLWSRIRKGGWAVATIAYKR